MTELVISLFPGVGLLDRAFAAEGFCVVQAQDKITGGDIRDFPGIPGRFDGVVAGPPCQGFSVANTHRTKADHHSVQYSREMLQHTCRIIAECEPEWFVIENVPTVPDVRIDGYTIQRISISDLECGGNQLRVRHVQFGHVGGKVIRPIRVNDCTRNRKKDGQQKPSRQRQNAGKIFPTSAGAKASKLRSICQAGAEPQRSAQWATVCLSGSVVHSQRRSSTVLGPANLIVSADAVDRCPASSSPQRRAAENESSSARFRNHGSM